MISMALNGPQVIAVPLIWSPLSSANSMVSELIAACREHSYAVAFENWGQQHHDVLELAQYMHIDEQRNTNFRK
jgi:hypothetical protein